MNAKWSCWARSMQSGMTQMKQIDTHTYESCSEKWAIWLEYVTQKERKQGMGSILGNEARINGPLHQNIGPELGKQGSYGCKM